MKNTLIIIPTYNSEKRITGIVDHIKSSTLGTDFLVVDRGSTDNTMNILKANKIPRMSMKEETTYYQALLAAIKYGYRKKYDYIIEVEDKDLFTEHDFIYLKRTMEYKQTDFILTSRYKLSKRIFNKNIILSFFASINARKKITDPTLRFKVYGKRPINYFGRKINSLEPTPPNIVHLIRSNYSFVECDVKVDRKQKLHTKKSKPLLNNIKWSLQIAFINPFRKKV